MPDINEEPEIPGPQGTEVAPAKESGGGPEAPETPEGEGKNEGDELPKWARDRLTKANAEAANYRTRLREAEMKLSAVKSVEELEAATKELRDTNQKLERQVLVSDVARRFSLPDDLAKRLDGTTAEELEADAKALQRYAVAPPGDLRGGLDPSDEDEPFNPVTEARRARAFRY